MKITAIIALAIFCTMAVQAQTRVVNGQLSVFDSFSVQNVEITSQKANATTMTDSPRMRKLAVGYGYLTEADLNNGISCLEQQNHDFCSYATIYDLIRGQLSGVTVNNNEIYVRGGNNSFVQADTKALYVVDNLAVSDIDWIQPCQVKSISVLKDSNAAIYGVRGGNGVVLIDTMK